MTPYSVFCPSIPFVGPPNPPARLDTFQHMFIEFPTLKIGPGVLTSHLNTHLVVGLGEGGGYRHFYV